MSRPCVRAALVLALLVVPAQAALAGSYQAAVLASKPLAYWPLDEAGGIVVDATRHGHDGVPDGSPEYGLASLLPSGKGTAVRVSPEGRFEIPAFEKWGPNSSGYTVEYWIKVNSATSYFTQAVGDGVDGDEWYMMQYLEDYESGYTCPRPHYGFNNGGYDPSPCTIGALFTFGEPHHVVATWDQPSGVVQIYIDGRQFTQDGKPTGVPTYTDLEMWLGHDNRELPGWDLVLDEVAFWDRALRQQEVLSHLSAAGFYGKGPAGAHRSPLFSSQQGTCPGGASDTAGATFGFVIMNTSSDGKLLSEVSVVGGSPNATYSIWVNQDPGDCPTQPTALLKTNRNGNGNTHAVEPRLPGATHFWVSAVEEPYGPGKQILRSVAGLLN